jgi:hypothetical protein
MAPQQKKLKVFFEERRREVILDDWRPLKSSGGEMRLKLLLRMPLLNRGEEGIPEEISHGFNDMRLDDSPINSSKLNIMYDGMTVEFFTDEQMRTPWTNGKDGIQGGNASITGVLLDKFVLIAKGKGEKRSVDLSFIAYVTCNVGMKDWVFEYLHGTSFMEATYSQSEIDNAFMREEKATEEAEEEESPQLTLGELSATPEEEPDFSTM